MVDPVSGAVIARCYDSAASTVGRSRRPDALPVAPSGRARPDHLRRTPLDRFSDLARQGAISLLWLVAAALIALGAAGVVAGMDTPSADGTDRTGRTRGGDALVDAALDEIEADLGDLADAVGTLGQQARIILASLASNDTEAIDTATALGTGLVGEITGQTEAIRTALTSVPVVGSRAAGYQLSPATVDRFTAYAGSLGSVDGVEGAWTRLTVGALSANRLSSLMAAHDDAIVDAAAAGRRGAYAAALDHLDDADAAIADAKIMRDRLAATVDVSTLDQWLDRSGDYDVALRRLYETVRGGGSDAEIREALRREQAAKDRLPPDTRALVLIMSDIGRGGIDAAAVDIERAHADLQEVLAPAAP
jgi:hypothetical protein